MLVNTGLPSADVLKICFFRSCQHASTCGAPLSGKALINPYFLANSLLLAVALALVLVLVVESSKMCNFRSSSDHIAVSVCHSFSPLCGVLVFGSVSRRLRPPPARRLSSQICPHTTCPHTTCSRTTCPHTTCSHTTCPHTTCYHTTCSHTTCPDTCPPHTPSPHNFPTHNLSTHNLSSHHLLTHNLPPHTHTQLVLTHVLTQLVLTHVLTQLVIT